MTPLPTTGWLLTGKDDDQHVIPIGDLREHEESAECWCKPFSPPGADGKWAHNAMDRRDERSVN